MTNYSFSDYLKGWMEIYRNLFPAKILLYSENSEFLDFIAAWYIVTSLLTNENDENFFQHVILVVPSIESNKAIQIERIIGQLLDNKTLVGVEKAKITNRFNVIYVPTFQIEQLLQQLEQMPEGTAVGVLYSTFYRSGNLYGNVTSSPIKTWMGININSSTAEELSAVHLVELVNKTLVISNAKQLFVTYFCQFSSYFPITFKLEFDTNDDVVYIKGSKVSKEIDTLEKIQLFMDQIGTKPIGELIKEVPNIVSDPVNRAILNSHIYYQSSLFLSAWNEIEIVLKEIIESENGSLILSACNIAFSAGKVKEGIELLRRALQTGISRIEELNNAYLLAKKSNQTQLAERILGMMISIYPESKLTILQQYRKLIDYRKYDEALVLAKKMNDEFEIKMCETFNNESLNLDDFIKYGYETNQVEKTFVVSTIEAIHRNQLEIASDLINRVPLDSHFVDDVFNLRLFLWINTVINTEVIEDQHISELIPFLNIVAKNPENIDYRFALERLFEDEVEEPTALVILATLLLSSIRRSFYLIDPSNIEDCATPFL